MTFIDVGSDLASYLDAPAAVMIIGDPGVGKSHAVAQVAGNCLCIVSSRKELRSFASFLVMRQTEANALKAAGKPIPDDLARDLKRKMPKKVIELPEFTMDANGSTQRVSNEAMIKTIVNAYKAKLVKEPEAYSGIVFDTWSILAKRVHEDMSLRIKDDTWGANRELHAFHRWLCRQIPQETKKSVVLVCHKREAEFEKNGTLKTMGGPLLPTGPMGKPVAGEVDFVMEYKVEMIESGDKMDGTWKREARRCWSTEEDPFTLRKRRDFRINPIEYGSLEEVFAKAGVVI